MFNKKDFFSDIKLRDNVSKDEVNGNKLILFLEKIDPLEVDSVELQVSHEGLVFIKESNTFKLDRNWFIVNDLGVVLVTSILDKISFQMNSELIKITYNSGNSNSYTNADIVIKLKSKD